MTCTHQSLLINTRCVAGSGGQQWLQSDLVVGWLPLFHDMGLVATTLSAITHGVPVALMSPASFVSKPLRWLWAMHALRATLSFAPNFAYQLCLKRYAEQDAQGLDLSSWRIAYNGAEFVHVETVRRFIARFSPHGFSEHAFLPCYGMAEMVVAVSFHEADTPLVVDTISRGRMSRHGRAIPVEPEAPDAIQIASVGRAIPGHAVQIRGRDGCVLGDREQGEIALVARHSSAATTGIRTPRWRCSRIGGCSRETWATWSTGGSSSRGAARIHHPRRGELPPLRDGGCRLRGRQGEGRVRGGRRADQRGHWDRGHRHRLRDGGDGPGGAPGLRQQVEEQVRRVSGLRPDHVLAVAPRTVPKTTSGKIRRGAVRELVLQHLAASEP